MSARDFVGELGDLAGDALRTGGIRVAVKTNLGPELELGAGSGVARALGIRGAVVVRDRQGRLLFSYGDPPPTSHLLVATLSALAAVLGFLLVRGVVKR